MSEGTAARHLPYTWDDYRSWDDDRRWEIIGGEAYAMSPAPTTRHQRIHTELVRQMANHFAGHPCQTFSAPTDVKLSDRDIVQPDILVACDPNQIRPTHIEGPPALVIEILSPSTGQRDRVVKMDLYARAGVREVWLVTPFPQSVEVFVLDGATYRRATACGQTGSLVSPTSEGLTIDLVPVFDFPLEPGEEPPVVLEPPGHYRAAAPEAAPVSESASP